MPSQYPPFARPHTASGDTRRTGIEIEFAGLDEAAAGRVVARSLGGKVVTGDSHELTVQDSAVGDIRVELDTVLRKKKGIPLLDTGLSLATGLVPVEIITGPLTPVEAARLDDLTDALRQAGATGTRDGILLGFGVHLNPEVVAPEDPHTLHTILAYGLLEPWLRKREGLDVTRRMMPFVKPWPSAFVTELARAKPASLNDLMAVMSRHVQSRNHGLDLFPLFAHANASLYNSLFPEPDKTSARPTFHFRLPDCRIDEADWSLAQAWALWCVVEQVAAQPRLLDGLRQAWIDHMHSAPGAETRWIGKVDAVMRTHDFEVDV
ncbi:amidoligase family protein [Sagittula sp. SSi028]|uniref:amidoligase family protein n=1 Tax=Sagittula sp. SSi028 TaxID=3400636 RepID=UPI003AF4EA69